VSGPYRIRFCSPPKRRPDAAAWPTARDVSQRVEPDVRPRGCMTSALIEDKAHRLSIPLAGGVSALHLLRPVHSLVGGVSPQHLLRPVHSARRQRPVHSTGDRRRARPFHWQAARPYCHVHYAHDYSHVTKEAAVAYQYYMDCGHHGARRLLRRYLHQLLL
jgi:hypothetical protein